MKIKVVDYTVELPSLPDWVEFTAPKGIEVEVRKLDDLPAAIEELVEVDYNDWAEVEVTDIEFEFDIKELLMHAEYVLFDRDNDETGRGGLWDLAGELSDNELEQEQYYNMMWASVEALQESGEDLVWQY